MFFFILVCNDLFVCLAMQFLIRLSQAPGRHPTCFLKASTQGDSQGLPGTVLTSKQAPAGYLLKEKTQVEL